VIPHVQVHDELPPPDSEEEQDPSLGPSVSPSKSGTGRGQRRERRLAAGGTCGSFEGSSSGDVSQDTAAGGVLSDQGYNLRSDPHDFAKSTILVAPRARKGLFASPDDIPSA